MIGAASRSKGGGRRTVSKITREITALILIITILLTSILLIVIVALVVPIVATLVGTVIGGDLKIAHGLSPVYWTETNERNNATREKG